MGFFSSKRGVYTQTFQVSKVQEFDNKTVMVLNIIIKFFDVMGMRITCLNSVPLKSNIATTGLACIIQHCKSFSGF